jgi:hypothetical protein
VGDTVRENQSHVTVRAAGRQLCESILVLQGQTDFGDPGGRNISEPNWRGTELETYRSLCRKSTVSHPSQSIHELVGDLGVVVKVLQDTR